MNLRRKMLKIMNQTVYFRAYDLRNQIDDLRDMVKDGTLSAEYIISHYNTYVSDRDKDFLNIESTCTYRECVDICLTPDETLVIDIYDGDTYHGHRTNYRSTFHLKGNWWEYRLFADAVLSRFERYADAIRIEREDEEKRRVNGMIMTELLRDFEEKAEE